MSLEPSYNSIIAMIKEISKKLSGLICLMSCPTAKLRAKVFSYQINLENT